MRWLLGLTGMAVLGVGSVCGAQQGAAIAAQPMGDAGAHSREEVTLPIRSVTLYTNGLAFVEQAGVVRGDALVRLEFTPAQLNDALASLTAVDLGGGRVTGAGYHVAPSGDEELRALERRMGPNAGLADVLRSLKGKQVEVREGKTTFAGRVLSAEPAPAVQVAPVGSFRSGLATGAPYGRALAGPEPGWRLTVVSPGGVMRSFDLKPGVEVRVLGANGLALTRYLELLAHEPAVRDLRHVVLADRGTGVRELHVSYLTAAAAWKSSYRMRVEAGSGTTRDVGLEGWAVVDNMSAADWNGVQLTLISGAPQSFLQQIGRPLDFVRPEVPMPQPGVRVGTPGAAVARDHGTPLAAQAEGYLGQYRLQSRVGAGTGTGVGTGTGTGAGAAGAAGRRAQGTTAKSEEGEETADAPGPNEVVAHDLDDLFEFRLKAPFSLRAGESATLPILERKVQAQAVTVWNPRATPGRAMRALYFANTTGTTLDRGSVAVLENGTFAGEGQMELTPGGQHALVRYGLDEGVSVEYSESKAPPEPYLVRYTVEKGVLTVHRRLQKERDYVITNRAATPRLVMLEVAKTPKTRLETREPAFVEHAAEGYRFVVPVAASGETRFKLVESHSHPDKYKLAEMNPDDAAKLVKQAGGNAAFAATMQPFVDLRKQVEEADRKLRLNAEAARSVEAEEERIQRNMAALHGGAGENALSRRYADEMTAQEDKLQALHAERDALMGQKRAWEEELHTRAATVETNAVVRS